MRYRKVILAGAIVIVATTIGTSAYAGPKAVERYRTQVGKQTFKVIRYDNNSVKISATGFYSPGYSYKLRDQMRQAAKQATGCEIADDFDQDGKLLGTLACHSPDVSSTQDAK